MEGVRSRPRAHGCRHPRVLDSKLDNADMALFFYAGHGLQVNGSNYLVPIDAKLERAGDLNFETIDVDLVLQQMEAAKRINLVFLDTCHAITRCRDRLHGHWVRARLPSDRAWPLFRAASKHDVSFATRPNTVALDGEGRNSPFTTALLRHLATPNVDVGLLMRRVSGRRDRANT